ncbi:hypothetical protein CDAR_557631 [Caerostris darwini]|uniref:Uncharacterized protein n=1 Tax=Caerostris darwini TaxID=1538125 RepID=A0AAV4TEL9_9ARAC|nr:hypothetical protein CDAR_557631 [Caerostris darwini]
MFNIIPQPILTFRTPKRAFSLEVTIFVPVTHIITGSVLITITDELSEVFGQEKTTPEYEGLQEKLFWTPLSGVDVCLLIHRNLQTSFHCPHFLCRSPLVHNMDNKTSYLLILPKKANNGM